MSLLHFSISQYNVLNIWNIVIMIVLMSFSANSNISSGFVSMSYSHYG